MTRWRGGVAATAFLAAVGAVAGRDVLILAAAIPLAYVAYGRLSSVPVPTLAVSRTVDPSPVAPGQPVTVTLTVENEGDRTVPDVRVVDAVPDELAVVEGSPRGAGALAVGESLVVEYTVAARRGEYDFASPRVRLRSLGAGAVATERPAVSGDDRLVCRLTADVPPLDEQGNRSVGQLTTDRPGRGTAFHSIREYRQGDPAHRIDWRHYAKQGELATVNYQQRLAATVVLVVDARPASRVVAGPGRPTAVELGAYAATQALENLVAAGHETAVAVLGDTANGPAGLHWVPPGGGRDHRATAQTVLAAATEAVATDPPAEAQVHTVADLTPPGAQVVLFSPLLDDLPARAVETWRVADLPCTVLSPDVLTENTMGGQFDGVRRHTRLARCQSTGARTVDWRRGTPLPVALDRAFAASGDAESVAAPPGGGG